MFDNFIKRDGKTSGIKVLITLTWIFLFITWALMLAGVVLFFLGNALITVDFFSVFVTGIFGLVVQLFGVLGLDTWRQNAKDKLAGMAPVTGANRRSEPDE